MRREFHLVIETSFGDRNTALLRACEILNLGIEDAARLALARSIDLGGIKVAIAEAKPAAD